MGGGLTSGLIGGGLTLAGIAAGVGFGLGAKDSHDGADSVLGRIRQKRTPTGCRRPRACAPIPQRR